MRIVSLVPSLTEFIADVKGAHSIIGRTRFCVHPDADQFPDETQIIGGTKNPTIERIRSLSPDLIVANREENRKEDIEELQKDTDVLITDISTIEEAFDELSRLGDIIKARKSTTAILDKIKAVFEDRPRKKQGSVLYLIWRDPWMSVGGDTYIHDVLTQYGFSNILGGQDRYPQLSDSFEECPRPDTILLSSEPYPFKETHRTEISAIFPDARIELVNGEWFSWYGSRMLPAFTHLNRWIHSLS